MPFVTADQLVAHAVGDYIIQSDWMANEKTKRDVAALAHALTYVLPFLFLGPSAYAVAFMVVTHFAIDRWRLARYVCWTKNFLAPRGTNGTWAACSGTGYSPDRPTWLAVWLMIIADNVMHVLCNAFALRFM